MLIHLLIDGGWLFIVISHLFFPENDYQFAIENGHWVDIADLANIVIFTLG